jgi:[ribosomal protein S18]-alanine N-acetyltransferase
MCEGAEPAFRTANHCKIHCVITLRDYRARDFDELWRIDQECFRPGIAYSRRELAWYIGRSRAFTLVAEEVAEQPAEQKAAKSRPNRIAGFVVAESDPSGIGHILTIDVHPAHQRSKVGSRLLEAAEARLRQQRTKAILLETAVDNLPALAFYKRHGYSVIETIPRYYLDSVDALVMGKRLDVSATAKVSKARVKKT